MLELLRIRSAGAVRGYRRTTPAAAETRVGLPRLPRGRRPAAAVQRRRRLIGNQRGAATRRRGGVRPLRRQSAVRRHARRSPLPATLRRYLPSCAGVRASPDSALILPPCPLDCGLDRRAPCALRCALIGYCLAAPCALRCRSEAGASPCRRLDPNLDYPCSRCATSASAGCLGVGLRTKT